jgi:hypothetical protein
MASSNVSLITKCFLVVLLGIALVVLNSGKIPLLTNVIFQYIVKRNKHSINSSTFFYMWLILIQNILLQGMQLQSIPPCENLLTQGLCSHFPDCNQHCLSIGWKCGGLCKVPCSKGPLVVVFVKSEICHYVLGCL